MDYTHGQQEALIAIEKFLDSKGSQIFILKGYAGTGKTTLIKPIVEMLNDKQMKGELMAPTGRAVKVLTEKVGYLASTIHRSIYSLDKLDVVREEPDKNDSDFDVIYRFVLKQDNDCHICIVDEASMVSSCKSQSGVLQFGSGVLLDDLLSYVNFKYGGKIIFIGDPAQLPPVGDNESNALNEEYFNNKGLCVESQTLTEVIRQDSDSTILKNAMKIRDLLDAGERSSLVFETKENEVEEVTPDEAVKRYCKLFPKPEIGDSVIITYSNSAAKYYNDVIRQEIFPEAKGVSEGDLLLVNANNYKYGLLNGDFVKVTKVGAADVQSAPVWVKENGESVRKNITLTFRNLTVELQNGTSIDVKIIEDLLHSKEPTLSLQQLRALYINFKIRFEKFKKGTALEGGNSDDKMALALQKDEYYNALHVKYGYAITGHKSQGGEWNAVFVDYSKRVGFNDECLRWCYTATTRTRHTLYCMSIPCVTPMSNIKIIPMITKVNKVPDVFYAVTSSPETPFHSKSQPAMLKAKYWAIADNFNGTDYSIANVKSNQFQEIYVINTPDGTESFKLFYNKSYLFKPFEAIGGKTAYTAEIIKLLNDEDSLQCFIDYKPSRDFLRQLYARVTSLCNELSIKTTNVVEHEWAVNYYFKTSASFAYVIFNYNGKMAITRAQFCSSDGDADEKLKELIIKLQ